MDHGVGGAGVPASQERSARELAKQVPGQRPALVRAEQTLAAGKDGAPNATDARLGWAGELAAAAFQGAACALAKGAADRGTAESTRTLTGVWPEENGHQAQQAA